MFGEKITGWIMEDHCAYRLINDHCEDIAANRVCFIEKTPRVRLSKSKYAMDEGYAAKQDAWIYGNKGSDYGEDVESRAWCDKMLELLGYNM